MEALKEASEFLEKCGVAFTSTDQLKPLTILSQEERDYIKIEFKDNGIGISDSRKVSIFERGNRRYQKSRGMGLGLSLVKKVIDLYQGKIWVEDRVKGDYKQGSNFVLLIPLSP